MAPSPQRRTWSLPRRPLAPEPAVHLAANLLARREEAVQAEELAANLRGQAADRREAAADRRDKAADRRDQDLARRAEASAKGAAQSREATARLSAALEDAQSGKEAAEQATDQMCFLAEHDVLTSLPNRTLLRDRLDVAIAAAVRHDHGQKIGLLFLDLDHFKAINDALGHTAGDQVLKATACRLLACVRLSDTVCRQGGDEFIVLLPEIKEVEDALSLGRKLLHAMERPHCLGSERLRVTLSIGISLFPDHGRDAEALIRAADTAMYHAKTNGRNNCHVFDPADPDCRRA